LLDVEQANLFRDRGRLQRVAEQFPGPYLATQVGYYYGELSAEKVEEISLRIWEQLYEQEIAGQRLDLDEAVRLEIYSCRQDPVCHAARQSRDVDS